MKIYLAGPVGYGHPGKEWKEEIKSLLRKKGHEVYDPIKNDGKYPEVDKMNRLKLSPKKHHLEIKRIMQQIFLDDTKYISNADYVICYFAGRALGTSSEQGIAYYLNKLGNRKTKTISIFDENFNPDEWVICCSDHIFFDIKSCIKYLKGTF